MATSTGAAHASSTTTPFRQTEVFFKQRSRAPDLSHAFPCDVLEWSADDTAIWTPPVAGPSKPQRVRRKALAGRPDKHAVCFEDMPGLVLLPDYLAPALQRDLVRASLLEAAVSPPNTTSLDPHYDMPDDGIWRASREPDRMLPKKREVALAERTANAAEREHSVKGSASTEEAATSVLQRLRWATVGTIYDWTKKIYLYDRPTPPVPSLIKQTCEKMVSDLDWTWVFGGAGDWDAWPSSYVAEAGLINFYHPKDTLTGHVDQAESDATSPLVSISIGLPAVFLVGGRTKDTAPVALHLRSGDVVIMSGPARQAYHDGPVPAAITSDEPDWQDFLAYMHDTRVNLNVRQVACI